jgi:hypothetical protein
MVEDLLEVSEQGRPKFREPIFSLFLDQIVKADSIPSRIVLTSQDYIPAPAEGCYLSQFHEKRLEGLQEAEALELFKVWNIDPQKQEELQYIQRLIRAYECHPLTLRVIAGEIQGKPFDGDISAYWNEYGRQIEAVEYQTKQASIKPLESGIRN